MRVQTPQMYALLCKIYHYSHTQTRVCICKYLCVGIHTGTHTCIHMVMWSTGAVSPSCKPKAVSEESRIQHFYFPILTSKSQRILFPASLYLPLETLTELQNCHFCFLLIFYVTESDQGAVMKVK